MLKNALARLQELFASEIPIPREDALVLSGGGARASYQAGVLQYIAEVFTEAQFSILTGVSAGAINAAHMANHTGTFRDAATQLTRNWHEITADNIFEAESSMALIRRVFGRSLNRRHPSESVIRVGEGQALVDTAPLKEYLSDKLQTIDGTLTGVTANLNRGSLRACCVTATNYLTGQTVTWVQGRDIDSWQRPNRLGMQTTLSVDHIMASTALPLLFPAVRIDNAWYGDGGIRLSAPLSPAVHLGATGILVISTRYNRSRREASEPAVVGYPPAAQVMGLLMNAIFLDVLDQDAVTMRRINELVRQLPRKKRLGFRAIKLLMIRPSKDLGKMASEYNLKLSGALKLLTGGLGTGETKSPDWLSMLLFDDDYVSRLMELGWEDARAHHDQIEKFLDPTVRTMSEGTLM